MFYYYNSMHQKFVYKTDCILSLKKLGRKLTWNHLLVDTLISVTAGCTRLLLFSYKEYTSFSLLSLLKSKILI